MEIARDGVVFVAANQTGPVQRGSCNASVEGAWARRDAWYARGSAIGRLALEELERIIDERDAGR